MKSFLSIIVLILLLGKLALCQDSETYQNVNQWIESNFAEGKVPPFSFVYEGKSSDSFIRNWHYSSEKIKSTNRDIEKFAFSYSDKRSGLSVKCIVTAFKNFPAVEWVLNFSNKSNRNTSIIEKVAAVNHEFSYKNKGTFILHHAEGCNSQRSDFKPYDDELKIGKNIYLSPNGGRSSGGSMAFPFFNIESPANSGIMVAIGWTGKWYADILQNNENSVLLKAGMERMKLFLFPREEIRTPKICLLFWSNPDRMTGHNQFRRFVLAHHTRKINEKIPELPLSAALGHGGPSPCNEYTCATEKYVLSLIDRHQQFDIVPEVFWIDAGWYPNRGDWHNVGSWTVNKENFPNGLKPVSEAVHKVGAKFLLWFEPERVRKDTQIEKEHPGWLTKIPGSNNLLFNLGNKEALNWLTNHISGIIENEGIDIYRQDFNMDPLPYWEKTDPPGRKGISEIRYIEGLYAYWDTLLSRFPNLIIDNCASGGRRIDLETISRSSPFWRTDFHGYEIPNGSQDNTYGLNFYLPLHGTGNVVRSRYYFRSNMSSTIVLNWNINDSNHSVAEMQKYMQEFKCLRPYYYGDYYPLTETGNLLKDNTWLAYQMNRPKEGDGIILAFRREKNRNESICIKLRGLEEKTTYELFYEDYNLSTKITGRELMNGIDITIPQHPSSLLIKYHKLTEKKLTLPAHSHNDYEQARPLFNAVDCRFKSIEADVHLIGDSLFVAHNSKEIKPGRTLRRLYLEPLKKLIAQNDGSVYGNGEEMILLVDIKSEGLPTYKQLDSILQDYKSILSVFESGQKKQGAVSVIVSGNRPFNFMKNQDFRLAGYDGRINDLEKNIPVNLMPLVSDNWTNHFTWKGEGEFPAPEKEKLKSFIQKAKNKGYLLRFWQTPVTPVENRNAVWMELVNAGVGLTGTDDIEALQTFLLNHKYK